MLPSNPDKTDQKQRVFNVVLAVLAAQVGCLTLVIILASVLGGLWLDSRLDTKPVMTLVLLVASIPVSVVTMLIVVRKTVSKMKTEASRQQNARKEENQAIGAND